MKTENTNEITLVQSPIIKHKLKEAGTKVTERLESLELDKQVATIDTVKSLKDLRAELNKELADFETQRKFIKEGVNSPYLEFETTFKTEITDKYKSAIDLLKDKIGFVEDKIKAEKKANVVSYFNEFCESQKIDFVKFENTGIEINLSTTEKKYKEQCGEYILKIVDDLNLIKSTDFEAEILTEYKVSLNVSNAITSVKTRKENERIETERLLAEQNQNRINYCLKLGMVFVEITNSYEFNADIYILKSDITSLSKEDFTKKYLECEAKIKDFKSKEIEAKTESEATVSKPIEAPLAAPIVQETKEAEPIKKAQFEVTATMTKLRALGEYLRNNNITYKNI